MPIFNKESQQETNSQQAPLIASYMKEHPEDKEKYFAINAFKSSKNDEWMICTEVKERFTILINKQSKQFEALMKLIDESMVCRFALICVFDPKMKSSAALGLDEEWLVNWSPNPDSFDYRYCFQAANNTYTTPPLTPVEDEVGTIRRRKAKPTPKPA